VIAVAVGTFVHGFDELISAADGAVGDLRVAGFAQIGGSSITPRNLEWFRFASRDDLLDRLSRARVLVCHAGMGLVGDGIRSGCRIVLFPRRGATTRRNPANDQTAFATAIAERFGLSLCLDPSTLRACIAHELDLSYSEQPIHQPTSNVPSLVAEFLAGRRPTLRA